MADMTNPGGLTFDQWQALQDKGMFDAGFTPPGRPVAPVTAPVVPVAPVSPTVPAVAATPTVMQPVAPMPEVKPITEKPEEPKLKLASDVQTGGVISDPYRQLGLQEFTKGYASQEGAIEAQKAAAQKAAGAEAGANAAQAKEIQESLKQQQDQFANINKFYDLQQKDLATHEAKMSDLIQDIREQKIDPNKIWSSKSTGEKVMAGIGLVLGGIGAGLTRSGQNQAFEFMNQAIARDVDAQKAAIEAKKTGVELENSLYGRALQRTNDARSAQYAALAMGQELAKQKLMSTALLSKNPAVQANADMIAARLDEEIAKNKMAYGQSLLSSPMVMTKNQDLNMIMRYVPKDQQNEAIKQYNDINEHLHEGEVIKSAFDSMSKNQGVMTRISSPVQSTKQIESDTSTIQLAMAKLAGRLTENEAHIVENNLPKLGDDQATLKQKEKNLMGLYYSKTPKSLILESFGVNPAERSAGASGLSTLKPAK
jgi:hypothetical protein